MNATLRYGTVLLAVIFFLSGTAKLAGMDFEIQAFERWGYPLWFMYLVGVIEVMGAAGLIIKQLRALAAACLALFMIGPVVTHITHAEWAMLMIAVMIMLLSGWVARQNRKHLSLASLFASKSI